MSHFPRDTRIAASSRTKTWNWGILTLYHLIKSNLTPHLPSTPHSVIHQRGVLSPTTLLSPQARLNLSIVMLCDKS